MTRLPRPSLRAVGLIAIGLLAPLLHAELAWSSRTLERTARLGEDDVAFTFHFSNPTDHTVTIQDVETSCGCTAATLARKTYAPGEKGTLEVTLDTRGLSGPVEKTLSVRTTGNQPPAKLTLRVNVPTWLELSPRLLWWRVGDPLAAKEAVITLHSPEVKILSASSNSPGFTARLRPDPDGSRQHLALTPTATTEATQATVTVVAKLPGGVTRSYVVFAQVR
jgi:hypothetical protein